MVRLKQKIHLCNCELCSSYTPCLICGSKENLHRAHIIPRHVIECFQIENEEKRQELLSFTGSNVIPLCAKHHRDFDSFRLTKEQKLVMQPYLYDSMRDLLTSFVIGLTNTKGKIRIERWTTKISKEFEGLLPEIRFEYHG